MKDYTMLAMELFKIKRHIIITLYQTFKDKADPSEFNTMKIQLRKDLDVLKNEIFDTTQLSDIDKKELKKIDHRISVKVLGLKKEVDKINVRQCSLHY
ncbi:hypothetical protein [Flavobacterium rivuli]|nr:hypothetical protein [Flavobacterium rivuli]